MILLDTDHLSVFLDERDARQEALSAAIEPVAFAIVSAEEVLRGWLGYIHRVRDVHRQISAYARLGKFFDVLADWEIVPFDKITSLPTSSPTCAGSESVSARWISRSRRLHWSTMQLL